MPSRQQFEIYELYLKNDRRVNPTARDYGCQPERVRQAVARVEWHLKNQDKARSLK